MNNFKFNPSIFLRLLLISLLSASASFANMQIYPLRVHISPQIASASLTIRNKDTLKNSYIIKNVYFEQSSDGKLEETTVESKMMHSVEKIIRFSPRSFSLEPDAEQVVRVMARADKRLEPGDYRGHLRFTTEEAPNQEVVKDSKNMALDLKAKIAMSIPVLYRIEPFEKIIELSNFKLNLEKKHLSIQIKRISKNYYPYGKLVIYAKNGKDKVELLQVNGVQCFGDVLNFNYDFESISDSSKVKNEIFVDFIDTFAEKDVLIASSSIKI